MNGKSFLDNNIAILLAETQQREAGDMDRVGRELRLVERVDKQNEHWFSGNSTVKENLREASGGERDWHLGSPSTSTSWVVVKKESSPMPSSSATRASTQGCPFFGGGPTGELIERCRLEVKKIFITFFSGRVG